MNVYLLTFACPERGLIRRFERNKRNVTLTKRYFRKRYPLRELVLEEYIKIPEKKDALIDWLNEYIGANDGNSQEETN